MSNQEILEKAIQKAVEGGWLPLGRDPEHPAFISGLTLEGVDKCYTLSKGFAKALWGEEYVYRADCIESPEEGAAGYQEDYMAWEYHLREMVIAEDPIKYLGENL